MDNSTLDALDNITRLALQVPALTASLEAAEAEVAIQREARCHYEKKWRDTLASLEVITAKSNEFLARAEAAEAEAAACRAERARYGDIMTSKLTTAEAEVERLRAERERMREHVKALQQPLAVIYDLCQFNRDVGKGARLPPSLESDVLEALATTEHSGQDAAGCLAQ